MSRGVQIYSHGTKTRQSVFFYIGQKTCQICLYFSTAAPSKIQTCYSLQFHMNRQLRYLEDVTFLLNQNLYLSFTGASTSLLSSWSHSLRRRWLRHWRVWLDILEPASSQPQQQQQPQPSTSSQQSFSLLSMSRFPYLVVLVLLCFASSAGKNRFKLGLVHK